jgi:hypothetical protein
MYAKMRIREPVSLSIVLLLLFTPPLMWPQPLAVPPAFGQRALLVRTGSAKSSISAKVQRLLLFVPPYFRRSVVLTLGPTIEAWMCHLLSTWPLW